MSGTGLNPEQVRVAERPGEELFVSAGAGSGKTRAIAWRYANAVEGRGCEAADSAVAITFTEKAAGELAERIRRVLLERGDKAAARSVDAGWISTIHGFCARILRRHALEAGVDPRCAVVSDVEAGTLEEEAFEAAARALASSDEEVARLVEEYGVGAVRDMVVSGAARLKATGSTPEDIAEETATDLAAALAGAVGRLAEASEGFAALERRTATADANRDATASLVEELGALDADSAGAAREAFVLARGLSVPKTGSEELKELCGKAMDAAAGLERAAAAAVVAPHHRAYVRLLAEYDREYAERKSERGALDFDDLLSETARLLRERPDLADDYAERFGAFMVDEFQDTDPLQAAVVSGIARGRLCTVGDEKQSIYGWRFADVEVFRTRARAAGEGRRVEMGTNYRSHADVLRFVNETFSRSPLFPDDFLRLSVGRREEGPAWAYERPRVTLGVVDRGACGDISPREVEAVLVAARVVERLGDGARPDDIAILFRAMSHAGAYLDALRAAGVPVFAESGGSLLERPEVLAVLAVVRLVANVRDEEALVIHLAGPLGHLSEGGLLRLACAAREGGKALWDALARAREAGLGAEEATAAKRAQDLVAGFRTERGRMGLDTLIHRIVEKGGLDLALAARGVEGERALAALFRLARLAGEWERAGGGDAAGLLDYLRLREEHSRGEPGVSSGAEGVGAVRAMTVHAAKGLEFPFVVVPELGRTSPNITAPILLDRGPEGARVGFRTPAMPEHDIGRQPTEAWEELRDLRKAREREEEKRILYVACTRAREALFLTGSTDLSKEPRDTPLGWVMTALRLAGAADSWPELPAGVVVEVADTPPDVRGASTRQGEEADDRGADEPERRPSETRSEPPVRAVPHTISYSDLEKYLGCQYRYHVSRVAGLGGPFVPDGENGAGPAAFGTAVHAALSLAEGGARPKGSVLDGLARRHGLSSLQREDLERAVGDLLATEPVRRAHQMPVVRHEVSFAVPVGETLLVGDLDVHARDGADALVVDYKTGDTPKDARERHRLQAECYALAALADGARDVEVLFAYPAGDPVTFRFDADDAPIIEERIRGVLSRIEAGEAKPLERFDPARCPRCPAYRGLCPVAGPSATR